MFGQIRNRIRPGMPPVLACLFLGLTTMPAAALDLPDPLTDGDFIAFDQAQAELGQLLFYDKVLSGNRNIACATCHHHALGSADGLSLSVGEGGAGLGTLRTAGSGSDRIKQRVPRNAPALWNLGHRDVKFLFHDGRVATADGYPSGFLTPAGARLPEGLNSILAAQALFPMTSGDEMAGQADENPVGVAAARGAHEVWPLVAEQVRGVEAYEPMFIAAFDHVQSRDDITIVEVVNAIAAFIGTDFRNHDSPFDAYLAGDDTAMSDAEKRGMGLFFGEGGCSECHAGPMLSDQSFRAIGLPFFGPGRTRPSDPMARDVGRLAETDDLDDAYSFRVPFLRNIALTAPYGHNGAMPTLEAMVRHHLDPKASTLQWTLDQAVLTKADWLAPIDGLILGDASETQRILARIDVDLPLMSYAQVGDIVEFLHSLTGKTATNRPLGRPDTVPSGLPVD